MIQSIFPRHQVTVAFKMRSPLVSQPGHVSNGNNFGGGHYHASGHYSFCNKENSCQSHHSCQCTAMGITLNPGPFNFRRRIVYYFASDSGSKCYVSIEPPTSAPRRLHLEKLFFTHTYNNYTGLLHFQLLILFLPLSNG